MKISNSKFYFLTITALAALIIIGLYFFSRKGDCCGDCHMHDQVTEQVVETPASEQSTEVGSATEAAPEIELPETAATQNIK